MASEASRSSSTINIRIRAPPFAAWSAGDLDRYEQGSAPTIDRQRNDGAAFLLPFGHRRRHIPGARHFAVAGANNDIAAMQPFLARVGGSLHAADQDAADCRGDTVLLARGRIDGREVHAQDGRVRRGLGGPAARTGTLVIAAGGAVLGELGFRRAK